jgi:hypothetical protein
MLKKLAATLMHLKVFLSSLFMPLALLNGFAAGLGLLDPHWTYLFTIAMGLLGLSIYFLDNIRISTEEYLFAKTYKAIDQDTDINDESKKRFDLHVSQKYNSVFAIKEIMLSLLLLGLPFILAYAGGTFTVVVISVFIYFSLMLILLPPYQSDSHEKNKKIKGAISQLFLEKSEPSLDDIFTTIFTQRDLNEPILTTQGDEIRRVRNINIAFYILSYTNYDTQEAYLKDVNKAENIMDAYKRSCEKVSFRPSLKSVLFLFIIQMSILLYVQKHKDFLYSVFPVLRPFLLIVAPIALLIAGLYCTSAYRLNTFLGRDVGGFRYGSLITNFRCKMTIVERCAEKSAVNDGLSYRQKLVEQVKKNKPLASTFILQPKLGSVVGFRVETVLDMAKRDLESHEGFGTRI